MIRCPVLVRLPLQILHMSIFGNKIQHFSVQSLATARLGSVGGEGCVKPPAGTLVQSEANRWPVFTTELSFDGRSLRSPHEYQHILYIFRN